MLLYLSPNVSYNGHISIIISSITLMQSKNGLLSDSNPLRNDLIFVNTFHMMYMQSLTFQPFL